MAFAKTILVSYNAEKTINKRGRLFTLTFARTTWFGLRKQVFQRAYPIAPTHSVKQATDYWDKWIADKKPLGIDKPIK